MIELHVSFHFLVFNSEGLTNKIFTGAEWQIKTLDRGQTLLLGRSVSLPNLLFTYKDLRKRYRHLYIPEQCC